MRVDRRPGWPSGPTSSLLFHSFPGVVTGAPRVSKFHELQSQHKTGKSAPVCEGGHMDTSQPTLNTSFISQTTPQAMHLLLD